MKIKGYPKISERDFLKQVIDLAHIFGWKIAHFRPAKTEHGWRTAVQADGAGFPDIVMVRPPRLIFAELKSDKGKLTKTQAQWLWELRKVAGIEVYIWRPRKFDRIIERLQ